MTLYDPVTGLYGGIQNPEEENVSNFNPYRRQWFYKPEYPTKTKRSVINLHAAINPLKGLTIKGAFSYNYWERNVEHHLTDSRSVPVHIRQTGAYPEGVVRTYIRRYNYKNTFRSSELTANYNFNIRQTRRHRFAGMSQEYNKYDHDYYIKYDLVDPSLGSIDAGMTNGEITGNYNEWAMRSYFGRINLNWDNRYLLEADLRADGSSKFAPGHRWGYFPSVSAGWRISQEKIYGCSLIVAQ